MADGATPWFRAGSAGPAKTGSRGRTVDPLPEVLESPEGLRLTRGTLELEFAAALLSELVRRAEHHTAGTDPGPIPTALEALALELEGMPIVGVDDAPLAPQTNAVTGEGAGPTTRDSASVGQRDSRERPAPITAPKGAEETDVAKRDPAREAKPARTITANGETLTVREWAEKLGMAGASIYNRLARGWTEEEAVTYPPNEQPERITAAVKPQGRRSRAEAPAAAPKPKRRSPRPSVDLEAVNAEINEAFGTTAPARAEVRPDVELLLELVGIEYSLVARRADGALTLHIAAPTSATT